MFSGMIAAWLGISDSETEGKWVSVQTKSPVKYTAWGRRHPRGQRHLNCALMVDMGRNAGMWEDKNCDIKVSFVCKKGGQKQG